MASSSKSSKFVDDQVSIFWDLNTCPVPNNTNLKDTVNNIETCLKDVNRRNSNYLKYRLSNTRIVCGNLNILGYAGVKILKDQGFDLYHTVERPSFYIDHYQEKEGLAPDSYLEFHLLKYACEHSTDPTRNILIITGDDDFETSFSNFYGGGYTTFLAKCVDSCPNFGRYTNFRWLWENMGRGISGMLIYNTRTNA